MFHLIDFKTKQPVAPKDFIFIGDNNEPWEVCVNMQEVKEKIDSDYYKKPADADEIFSFSPNAG